LKTRLAKEFKSSKKNSQAAGVMALYLRSMQSCGVEYQGMKTHVQQVTTYLNQSVRLKWSVEHLRDACRLALHEELQPLLTKLAKRGRSLFSKDPSFHFFLGRAQILRGPADCNSSVAIKALNKAIELDNTGDIKLEQADRQAASKSLSMLARGPMPTFSGLIDMVGYDSEEDDLGIDGPVLDKLLATIPPELERQLEREGIPLEVAVRVMAKIVTER
jgi:hypothetical protein